MGRIDGLRRFFRVSDTGGAVTRDAELEVRFHLEMKVQELMQRGMSADQARAEALRRFGDVRATRERIEQIDRERLGRERRAAMWSAFAQDIRYAVRGLARQRGFAAVVVLTLGLAIGANATMFGIVDRLLLRAPEHVQDADGIVRLFFERRGRGLAGNTDLANFPFFTLLRDSAASFDEVAAVRGTDVLLGTGARARTIRGSAVTASFFPMLGVQPELGRFFAEHEDLPPAGSAVVVLGYGFWRTEYGGDPAVLGREIRLDEETYRIVGVAPRGFSGIDLERVDVWLPLSAIGPEIAGDSWHRDRGIIWIRLVGRLRPGVDTARANAEATGIWHASIRQGRNADGIIALGPRVQTAPLLRERGPNRTDGSAIATWLAGVAAVVLLIACANVANLSLARAMRRRREIALRLALGVGRGRLVRQLLTESLLLALLGGAAALVIARWGGAVLRGVLLPGIEWTEHLLDPRVLAFTAAAALLTGVLAGLAPALQATRADIAGSLKAGAREGTWQRSRTRTALLLSQAALSTVLLVGAGLFVLSLRNVRTANLGFASDRLLLVELEYLGSEVELATRLDDYRRVRERLGQVPGVQSVSIGTTVPFWSTWADDLWIPGRDSLPSVASGIPPLTHAVTPDYFTTLGSRIVSGRAFTEAENRPGAPRVVIVNETFARLAWPGETAIGKCLVIGERSSPCSEVVGVIEDSRSFQLRPEAVMKYYVPWDQQQVRRGWHVLAVRTYSEPEQLFGALRREIEAAVPRAAYADIRPLLELIDPQVRPWRLGATMFTLFGGLALLVAAIGLYSVMAYTVTQRTHEMGVRMALGARSRDVLRLVLSEGMRLAALGTVAGLVLALLAAGRVAPLLYEVAPNDPRVFFGVALALMTVALAANTVPAWRAARVDPLTALKAE